MRVGFKDQVSMRAIMGMWRLVCISASVFFLAASSTRADIAVAWGYNNFGQLGNGTTTASNTPVFVSGMGSGVTAVGAGADQGLAIQNGAVKAWGYNNDGELGDGSTSNSNVPVSVTGLSSGVSAISGGGDHELAIQNGVVKAWGDNFDGQLGQGFTSANSTTPVSITGLSSGISAVASGGYHSLAIQNGAAMAWGENDDGQLGTGTTTDSLAPTAVSGLSSGATAIAGGLYHSLAIHNGAAVAWGYNADGELGNGTSGATANSDLPVSVTGLTSGVTAIAAGGFHSLAIQNGNVYAWGDDNHGQLGNGNTTGSNTPVLALDLSTNLIEVAAGQYCSYALSADGSLWVWGQNNVGQLGLGDPNTDRLTPTQLLAPAGYRFTGIAAEGLGDHAIATIAAVPEPATLGLLGIVTVGLMLKRKART